MVSTDWALIFQGWSLYAETLLPPITSLTHTLSVLSMNNHFMNITISAAIHLAQRLITESIWQTVEDSESFGLTQGTHLALPVKRGH